MPVPGQIWSHLRFYLDSDAGIWRPKYLLVLAVARGDVVYRLLTSRGPRARQPRCSHADPYPSYFLGVPGVPLDRETWLDLRECDDIDLGEFSSLIQRSLVQPVYAIPDAVLCDALLCAANAPDTTRVQRARMLATRSSIACP